MKVEKEEKDEFDAMIESGAKPLDDRLGSSPDKVEKKKKGGRQTTLPFKPVKKEKKSRAGSDDSSDDEINFDTLSPPRAPRAPRRAAACKFTSISFYFFHNKKTQIYKLKNSA